MAVDDPFKLSKGDTADPLTRSLNIDNRRHAPHTHFSLPLTRQHSHQHTPSQHSHHHHLPSLTPHLTCNSTSSLSTPTHNPRQDDEVTATAGTHAQHAASLRPLPTPHPSPYDLRSPSCPLLPLSSVLPLSRPSPAAGICVVVFPICSRTARSIAVGSKTPFSVTSTPVISCQTSLAPPLDPTE